VAAVNEVVKAVWAELVPLFQFGHRYDVVIAPPAISVAIDEIGMGV
jgi:hypothetical protein